MQLGRKEAFVRGISTRSVDELAQAIGMEGVSKNTVNLPSLWPPRWQPQATRSRVQAAAVI